MMNTSLGIGAERAAARPFVQLALGLIAAVAAGREAAAQSKVLRWEIEAVVVEVGDPDLIFGDVQVGDPVRGFLSYDRDSVPEEVDPTLTFYFQEPGFETAGMVIENPRSGGEIAFPPDSAGLLSDLLTLVGVTNDFEEPEGSGVLSDGLAAFMPVFAPDGFTGLAPIVGVNLEGPGDVFSDVGLPESLTLGDWEVASLMFADFFDLSSESGEFLSSYVIAEIHSLTPIPEPTSAGAALVAVLALGHRRRFYRSGRRA